MMGLYGFGGAGIFGALAMALFWIGVILLVIWAVGRFFPHERRSEQDVRGLAVETARRRYASGEISEEEYVQTMRALGYDEPVRSPIA